jgi:para-aminobenzoate synthetase / 4-amino-4-deoxychorismate lyase
MIAPGTVLLHDNAPDGGESLLFQRPHRVLTTRHRSEVAHLLGEAETAVDEGFHLAGWLSYELGLLFEERLAGRVPTQTDEPLLWLGIYDAPQRLSRPQAWTWLLEHCGEGMPGIAAPVPDVSRDEYGTAFAQVMEYIRAGDVYQVNLTFPARFRLSGSPAALYRDLCLRQPVPHGALVATGEHHVLSLSPELFVQSRGHDMMTRPMKGTIARGADREDDRAHIARLQADEKTRAENLMIVDLLRNDLGRIAEIGSVSVDGLFAVETYPSLHQMTSTVRARRTHGTGLVDVLRALFPCGSVTGAPKIRAMQIIDEVERAPRGVYTGSIGHVAPGGDLRFNVAIRTAVIDAAGHGRICVGGGVVADSDVDAEYDEALLKLGFLSGVHAPFGLIETLLWDGAEFWLLERHMRRLARSAAQLGIAVDRAAAEGALRHGVDGRAERLRVRLLVLEDGRVEVDCTPLGPTASLRFAVAPLPVLSTDPLLRHKTTRRAVYDAPRAEMAARLGVDEVVFCNERGELTEGSFTNLFVRAGGRLLTPPLSCGLLPGTLREEVLETGEADEAVLTLNDLRSAQEVFLGNSVRGLVPGERVRE